MSILLLLLFIVCTLQQYTLKYCEWENAFRAKWQRVKKNKMSRLLRLLLPLVSLLALALPQPLAAMNGEDDTTPATATDVRKRQEQLALALMGAVDAGDAAKVAELLAAGADSSATNQYSISMLHTAAGAGALDVLRLLITHNASVNAQLDGRARHREGETPSHFAAAQDRDEALLALIAAGADVQLETVGGMTALHVAAGLGHVRSMRVLVEEGGGDVHRPGSNRFGSLPIHLAATAGKPDGVALLLELGSTAHVANQRGSFPIHGAFIVGDVEAAKLLIAAGANPGELNGDGATPIEAAVGRKDDPIVAAALEQLAELSSGALGLEL
jgi:ankyrin repeat protein